MKSVKFRVVLAGAILLLFTASSAIAATCTITGQNLVVAFAKARSNGYIFHCEDAFATARGFYSIPGRLGCRGRKNVPYEFHVILFGSKTPQNGWIIQDVTAAGGPGSTRKSLQSHQVYLTTDVPIMAKYNIYITKMKLKHRSKSCSNIRSVITDAFGQ
jgi:hypothetical protein